MHWYQTAIMLEKKHFERLTCNHQEINFYFKRIEDTVHIITLIDATKRYYYEETALTNLRDELERKFLLRGAKNVENIFIIYTGNVPFYKKFLESGINMWLVDMDTHRLHIYENQPDDFLQLKSEIEESLKEPLVKQKTNYPYITIGLIAVNIAVFLFMYIFTMKSDYYTALGANCWTNVFLSNEYYRLLTCMFIHGGSDHLVNNMLSLGVMGNETETKLGHLRFFILYMLSGLISSLASALYNQSIAANSNTIVYSVGASGAIFGVYGAYVMITLLKNRYSGNSIPVKRVILVTFLMLFSGFTSENIDNMAHLSGLLAGIIISFIYCKCDKSILKY